MLNNPKRYTITAALPYANGPVHIGHLAGCYIPADIYARYLRAIKKDIVFVCGSDEHGVPITIKAKNEGITPQQVVDKYHKIMGDAFRDFGISFDIYSRTSSKTHHETATEFFKTIYDKKGFTEKVTLQYYDEDAKQFLADRYIVGTCPKCANENAYGDQCEKCGTSLSPEELINPKSKLSGNVPIKKETKHWFLPLNEYSDWLKEWILEGHKDDWKSNVYGQCKSWLESGDGLQPRAMTRDLDWGVPVPVEGADGKVLYVWFDAPIGYISATKEYFATTNNPNHKNKDWKPYWQDNETKLLHFIGKDNIVFHSIIFPVILKAHGDYILPDNVPANEFLNLENDKISTSRNWAVWLHEYLQEFPNKQDELRYVLTSIAPETKDSDFSWKDYQARVNNELVAVFGNFVNRVAVLTHKFYNGIVPSTEEYTAEDLNILSEVAGYPKKIANSIEHYRFREALQEFMNLARIGNKYLADNEPWKLIKTDEKRVKTIMNIALQITANLSVLAEPFLPFTSKKMKANLALGDVLWDDVVNNTLMLNGQEIKEFGLLFEKVEDAVMDIQLQKLAKVKEENEKASEQLEVIKDAVSFDDFVKMDIRVGTILTAEKVAKADKLLKLTVDTGIDTRTVVSGIAAFYKPEEIIGKQVSILVNLAPRKLKGIESQGMILMAEDSSGKLVFVSPNESFMNGAVVK